MNIFYWLNLLDELQFKCYKFIKPQIAEFTKYIGLIITKYIDTKHANITTHKLIK